MPQLKFNQQLGAEWAEMGIDIRDLTLAEGTQSPMIIATTGPGGGMLSLRFANGQLQQFDQVAFTDAMRGGITGEVVVLSQGARDYIVLFKGQGNSVLTYHTQSGDGIGGTVSQSLPMYVGDSGPVLATSETGYVYTMTAPGRLQGFREEGSGFRAITSFADTRDSFAADPVALETLSVGGTEYLVALSGPDRGITTFRINARSGELSDRDAVGAETGLGLLANPTDMQTVAIGGRGFVVATTAADRSEGRP